MSNIDRLYDSLLHALRSGDVAKQRQLMIRMREANMTARSMEIKASLMLNGKGAGFSDGSELHRLNADSKGGRKMKRYKNPRGPRYQDVVRAYMR